MRRLPILLLLALATITLAHLLPGQLTSTPPARKMHPRPPQLGVSTQHFRPISIMPGPSIGVTLQQNGGLGIQASGNQGSPVIAGPVVGFMGVAPGAISGLYCSIR
jgi:hypothetical protein